MSMTSRISFPSVAERAPALALMVAKRAAAGLAFMVATAGLLACGGDRPGSERARGASEFTTALPPESGNTGAGNPVGPGLAVPRESPAFIAPGEVARVNGSILLSLNEYRGLQVLDVSGAEPQLLSSVRMPGRPVALFLEGTEAYAVIADAEELRACAQCPPRGPGGYAASQIQAVDLRDPSAPVVRSIQTVPGSAVGARLLERTLVVVSRGEGTWVTRYDLTGGGGLARNGWHEVPGPAWADQLHFADGGVLYLALYGSHRFVNGACVPAPPVGAPGTTLPEGCTQLLPVEVGGRPGPGTITPPFPGRVAPGGLDLDAGVLRVVRQGEETVNQPGPGRPPALLTFRQERTFQLAPLGELALPAVRNGPAPLFRFADGRAYVATDDPAAPVLIAETGAAGPPTLAGRLGGGVLVQHFVEATADRLLTVEQQVAPDQCPIPQLALHDVSAPATPLRRARHVLDTSERRATLLPGGLVVVPALAETLEAGAIVPRARLDLLNVDLALGTIHPRGRALLGGRQVATLLTTRDGKLLSLTPERLEAIDASDPVAPAVTGSVDVARWVEDVRFAGGQAVTLVSDPHEGRIHLQLHPEGDPDGARPLATLALEGQAGRMFVHDRFVYLFWHASLRVGRSDPRLDVIEVVDGTLRLRASRSLAGPAALALGPENDGDGSAGQGLRQIAGTTFAATLSRVTECRPGGNDPGPRAAAPGRAGTCAPALPTVEPTPLPPAAAIEDLPAAAETRRRLDGGCPGSGADLLVIDASDPAAPRVASLVRLPGGGELGPSVVQEADGARTLFVLQNEFTRPERPPGSVRRFVIEVDLRDPAAPAVGPRVNVPGEFLAARADTWFTAEPLLDDRGASTGMAISALYRPAGSPRAYLERRLLLEGASSGPVVDGDALYATVEGELVVLDLAGAAAPTVLSRTEVPGANTSGNVWSGTDPGGLLAAASSNPSPAPTTPPVAADIHRVVGRHAFVMVGGRTMRAFDVTDPALPLLLPHVVVTPRGAHPVRLAPGNRAIVPRAEWGLDVIPLGAGR